MRYLVILLFALTIHDSFGQSASEKLIFFCFDNSKSKSADNIYNWASQIHHQIDNVKKQNDILKNAILSTDDGSSVRSYTIKQLKSFFKETKKIYSENGTFIVFFQVKDVPNHPSNSKRELLVEMVDISIANPTIKVLWDQIIGQDDISDFKVVENIVQLHVMKALKGVWKDNFYFYAEGTEVPPECAKCNCYIECVKGIFSNLEMLSNYYVVRGLDPDLNNGIVFQKYDKAKERVSFALKHYGLLTDTTITAKGCSGSTLDKNRLNSFCHNVIQSFKKPKSKN